MIHPIDAPVIDRVFQPIADRLTGVMSCFQLAKFFCDGAMIVIVADLLLYGLGWHKQGLSPPVIATAVGINIVVWMILLTVFRLLVSFNETYIRQGMINPGRFTLLPLRFVVIGIITGAALTTDWHHPWTSGFLGIVGFSIWLIAIYFASCSARPPRYKFTWGKKLTVWRQTVGG